MKLAHADGMKALAEIASRGTHQVRIYDADDMICDIKTMNDQEYADLIDHNGDLPAGYSWKN